MKGTNRTFSGEWVGGFLLAGGGFGGSVSVFGLFLLVERVVVVG